MRMNTSTDLARSEIENHLREKDTMTFWIKTPVDLKGRLWIEISKPTNYASQHSRLPSWMAKSNAVILRLFFKLTSAPNLSRNSTAFSWSTIYRRVNLNQLDFGFQNLNYPFQTPNEVGWNCCCLYDWCRLHFSRAFLSLPLYLRKLKGNFINKHNALWLLFWSKYRAALPNGSLQILYYLSSSYRRHFELTF